MLHARWLLAVFVAAALAGPILAEDVENPEFTSWAKFPKGTSIAVKRNTVR